MLLALSLLLNRAALADLPDPRAALVTAEAVAALQAVDPAAAAAFAAADDARDRGDLAAAGTGYAAVLQRVPDFPPALRRHCLVLQDSGQRDEALPRCRQAAALSDRPENAVALAYVLLDMPSGVDATLDDRKEARHLLIAADQQDPDDPVNARLRCQIAMDEGDHALLSDCVEDMERVAPDHVLTAWHAWALAHEEGRIDDALGALDRAAAAGMPPDDVASFRRLTLKERPPWTRWGPALLVGLVLGLLSFSLFWGLWRRRAGQAR